MVDLTGEPRAAELAPWAVPWLTLTSFRGVTLPPCTVDMDSEWEQIHSYMTSLLKWLYHSTDRRVPAELGQESQASSCLRKGTPLASRVAQGSQFPGHFIHLPTRQMSSLDAS